MAASAAEVRKLRRMTAETGVDSAYTDSDMEDYIEAYPLVDARGEDPLVESATVPGTLEENPLWDPTYDLNSAAADIWGEKAAALAPQYDYSADGGTYSTNQPHTNALRMAAYYEARRSPVTITQIAPKPSYRVADQQVGNLPEPPDPGIGEGWY